MDWSQPSSNAILAMGLYSERSSRCPVNENHDELVYLYLGEQANEKSVYENTKDNTIYDGIRRQRPKRDRADG